MCQWYCWFQGSVFRATTSFKNLTYFWTNSLWNRWLKVQCVPKHRGNMGKALWTISNCSEAIVLLRTTQQFMVFGFLLYAPIPLCTELTLPKPQTLMLCCSLSTFQAVSRCSSHFGYFFSLLPELGMHPVFLRNHQNQKWSLYAVEKAMWAAGLGHVLHASDKKKKKYRHNAKVELTV